MLAAQPPSSVATASADKAADVVVVRRETRSDVLASRDTPLPLIKGRKTEDALLRQAIFLTATLTVARRAAGDGQDVLRWTYQAYLQRQLCFTSITGEFSCAAADVEKLGGEDAGEAPLGAPPEVAPLSNRSAEDARTAMVSALSARAPVLFEDDRRLNVDPMLKAARVSIRGSRLSSHPGRR